MSLDEYLQSFTDDAKRRDFESKWAMLSPEEKLDFERMLASKPSPSKYRESDREEQENGALMSGVLGLMGGV